jgi:hypothetical protein
MIYGRSGCQVTPYTSTYVEPSGEAHAYTVLNVGVGVDDEEATRGDEVDGRLDEPILAEEEGLTDDEEE